MWSSGSSERRFPSMGRPFGPGGCGGFPWWLWCLVKRMMDQIMVRRVNSGITHVSEIMVFLFCWGSLKVIGLKTTANLSGKKIKVLFKYILISCQIFA